MNSTLTRAYNTIDSARILAEQPRTWTHQQPAGVPPPRIHPRGRARDVEELGVNGGPLLDFKLDINTHQE
jgi:hypothetical protein